MAKEFAVSVKGKSGLSGKENSEVIAALRQAKAAGEIPRLSFEYNSHPKFFGKDPLYLSPKTGDVKRAAVKVRTALRKRFGDKYSVYMV